MQSSGQHDNVEFTALAKEDRADNSDVPKIQRESIRTRRERLAGELGALLDQGFFAQDLPKLPPNGERSVDLILFCGGLWGTLV